MNKIISKLPDYEGGTISKYSYNMGCGVQDDLTSPTEYDSYARLILKTDAAHYISYIKKLEECGFEKLFENRLGDNLYTQLSCKEGMLYAYYTASKSSVTLVSDYCSTPLSSFCYTEKGDDCEIYQYALYYDQNNGHSPTTTNCGMLFIVRLADNSLYMYDGGDILQCSDEAVSGMMDFLHSITNTKKGEIIKIACWHISHAHNDHFDGCTKLLNRFHHELCVERFMFNFPSSTVRTPDGRTGLFKETVCKYCPDAMFLKPHTGQVITLANVSFTVLYTHEDSLREDSPSAYPLRDYNCSSTILKMNTPCGSVMWLGDTNVETEEILKDVYPDEIWRSDVLQVAHHCFNYLSSLYPKIRAPHAMLPNSYFGSHTPENLPKLAEVICHLESPDCISYSDTTSGFRFEHGKFKKFLTLPRIGGEYDFSGF